MPDVCILHKVSIHFLTHFLPFSIVEGRKNQCFADCSYGPILKNIHSMYIEERGRVRLCKIDYHNLKKCVIDFLVPSASY